MFFNKESIDFVKTYRNIDEELKPKKSINKFSYSLPVVKMAEAVIHRNMNNHVLLGIKRCLEYELKQCTIDYTSFLWSKDRIQVFEDYEQRSLIADSLILTILKYRYQLDERHTGLSEVLKYDITQGIEWVGNWIMRCHPTTKATNTFIETHDIENVTQFIVDV